MDLYTIRDKLNMGISINDMNLRVTDYARVSTEHVKGYFDEMYADKIAPFLKSGHIFRTAKGYAFTPEGMYVSNYILSRVVDFDMVF